MQIQQTVMSMLTVIAVVFCLSGCDQTPLSGNGFSSSKIDTDTTWLKQQLLQGNVIPRLENGMRQDGFYRPALAFDWAVKPEQHATLVSQSRFVYLMAAGYNITGEQRYIEAATKGADYLLKHFKAPDHLGVWYKKVDAEGAVVDKTFHGYGHTQVIFGFAHAYQLTENKEYLDAAMSTWYAMNISQAVAGKHSRYRLTGLNVSKHLFESLLVLYNATGSDLVFQDMELLANYIVEHFFHSTSHVFVEYLGTDGKPMPNGEVNLGHAVEMAFLLSRAVDSGLARSYLSKAADSLNFVLSVMDQSKLQLLSSISDYDGKLQGSEKQWWAQAELLRGLAHFSTKLDRPELAERYNKVLEQVKLKLIDPTYNGWYPKADDTTGDKGSGWKVGYHVTMFLTEAMRLQQFRFQSGNSMLL